MKRVILTNLSLFLTSYFVFSAVFPECCHALETEAQQATPYQWASFFPLDTFLPPSRPAVDATFTIQLEAYSRNMSLVMKEISWSEYANVHVTVVMPNGTNTYRVADQMRYFKGTVPELKGSRAHGIFRGNGQLFEGIIETDEGTYFVESPLQFFGNTDKSFSGSISSKNHSAVIYRWEDLKQFPTALEADCMDMKKSCWHYQTMQHYKALFPPDDLIQARQGIYRGPTKQKEMEERTCPIHVVADHRFFQYVGLGSIQKTLEAIVWHIEEADHAFLQADWNNDLAPDRIGVSLTAVTIFTSPDSPGNVFRDDTENDEVFLQRFVNLKISKTCVAAVFTFADLGGTFGISYVGTVCSSLYNWALINFRNVDGQVRQRAASVITIMHEVAHVFGASHDQGEERCLPAGHRNGQNNGGNYIMYPASATGMYENNRRFSPCSREAIGANLQNSTRTKCMVTVPPVTSRKKRRVTSIQ